ncbi:hypothetical protein AB0G15_42860, partial [Streptosporangium sp. NPDC023825]
MATTHGHDVHTGPVTGAVPAQTVPAHAMPTPAVTTQAVERPAVRRPADYVWAIARIGLGWIFLWAFLDKTFGWGFATPA